MQAKTESNLWGIDVSRYQGEIKWPEVAAAGVQFAFVKATDGSGWIDPMFRRNAGGASAVGIQVGFYHYAHPERNTALSEAEAFCDAVRGLPVDLPYVLDLEGEADTLGRERLTKWAVAWLTEVQKRTKKRVMIYTYASFANEYCGPELGQWPLWIANYGTDQPMGNPIWDRWAVFQYSQEGSCPGIAGRVDMNLMEVDFFMEATGQNKLTAFDDVPAGHFAEGAIAAVSEAGIEWMTGTGDGKFEPDRPITRGEMAVLANRILYYVNNR